MVRPHGKLIPLVLLCLLLGASDDAGIGRQLSTNEAAAVPSCTAPPVSEQMSLLVAASDLIVTGTLQIDPEQLAAVSRSASPDYLNVRLGSVHVLKGEVPPGDLVMRILPEDRPYAPSRAALAAAANRPSLVFLTHVDEGPIGFYFAGYSPAALQPADPGTVTPIAGEIARQRAILQGWRPDRALPHDREVAGLIDALAALSREAGPDAQQAIFQRIEALGAPAVPAIIAHMDDRRRLAYEEISLVNHNPDAFESMRNYGPKLIVDALAAILNQITGRSFGNIVNGGSERERHAAVDGWRIYAAGLRCAQRS